MLSTTPPHQPPTFLSSRQFLLSFLFSTTSIVSHLRTTASLSSNIRAAASAVSSRWRKALSNRLPSYKRISAECNKQTCQPLALWLSAGEDSTSHSPHNISIQFCFMAISCNFLSISITRRDDQKRKHAC